MYKFVCGVSCAALFATFATAGHAETMRVHVPVGVGGSLTATGPQAAKQELRRIPGGADVVEAEKFQEGYALSMKDMLATTPGVLAQPRYGEESRLSIRGSGLSRSFHLRGITLLQDGIPITFADGSGDFQEIDPLTLQHIEVYRGGQGLRYGAATMGGAINMVTPTAHTIDYEGLLRAEGGSDKTGRLHAQAAHTFDGADVFAAATSMVSDGFRRQTQQKNRRFSGNVGAALGHDAETRFYVAYNDLNQEVPGTVAKETALRTPAAVPDTNVLNDNARDIRSVRVSNRTAFRLDNGWKLETGGYVNEKSLYHPIFQVLDQNSVDIGGFTRLNGDNFVLGANIGRGVNDAKRFVNNGGKRGARTAYADQVAENIELYGEHTYQFSREWSLITGLQGTFAFRDYEDHLNAANNDDKTYTSLNPKIGVMWNYEPGSEVYASLTRSSEAPTFSELVQGAIPGFVPVDMQKAWTAEIGTRGSHGAFSWDVGIYHAQVRDELLNFTVTPDIPASTFNADKTLHQGIELGAGFQATDALSFSAIYNFNDFRFDGDTQYDDNDLAGAPPHQIRLAARYEGKNFFVEPNVELVPEAAWVDYANTMKSDAHTLVGLKGGWDVRENITLFFDARNLTDEENISSFSTVTDARTTATNVFYPGEGRSFYAGISVKF